MSFVTNITTAISVSIFSAFGFSTELAEEPISTVYQNEINIDLVEDGIKITDAIKTDISIEPTSELETIKNTLFGFVLAFEESSAEVLVSDIEHSFTEDGIILTSQISVQFDEALASYSLIARSSYPNEEEPQHFDLRLDHSNGTSAQTISFNGKRIESKYDFAGEERKMIYNHIDLEAVLAAKMFEQSLRTTDFPLHELAARALLEISNRGLTEIPVLNIIESTYLLADLGMQTSLSLFSPFDQFLFDVKGNVVATDPWMNDPGLNTIPKGPTACKNTTAEAQTEEGVANAKKAQAFGVIGELTLGTVKISAKPLEGSGLAGTAKINGGFVLNLGVFDNKTCPDPMKKAGGSGFAVKTTLDAVSKVVCTGKGECCTKTNDDLAEGAKWSLKFGTEGVSDSYATRKGNSTTGKTSINGTATLCIGQTGKPAKAIYLNGFSKVNGRSFLN